MSWRLFSSSHEGEGSCIMKLWMTATDTCSGAISVTPRTMASPRRRCSLSCDPTGSTATADAQPVAPFARWPTEARAGHDVAIRRCRTKHAVVRLECRKMMSASPQRRTTRGASTSVYIGVSMWGNRTKPGASLMDHRAGIAMVYA